MPSGSVADGTDDAKGNALVKESRLQVRRQKAWARRVDVANRPRWTQGVPLASQRRRSIAARAWIDHWRWIRNRRRWRWKRCICRHAECLYFEENREERTLLTALRNLINVFRVDDRIEPRCRRTALHAHNCVYMYVAHTDTYIALGETNLFCNQIQTTV